MRFRNCIISLISLTSTWAEATPTIAFPFNSQVPEVARKNQPYNFQLSASTFGPQDDKFVYSLSQQPAWLSIDSASRTLEGTPGDADVGSSTFTITAADDSGAAHMPCTLVVASDPAPQLQGDFSEQLAAEINLTSSSPATITLVPGTQFDFNFRQDSFIDIVQRKLYYYATLADHTPLPSWLDFDGANLRFTGTSPQLSAFPQSFAVALIASDYAGFAGATATFTLVVSPQQLVIVPSDQNIHISPGQNVNFTSLQNDVFYNGQNVAPSQLQSASANLPGWLTFDASTLMISGTAPQNVQAANGSVKIVDKQGNNAQVILHFSTSTSSLFSGNVGNVTAMLGQDIDYQIPSSVMDEADASLVLTVPSSADWITFDSTDHVIHGVAPTAAPSVIAATLAASAPGITPQSQVFNINVVTTLNGSSIAAQSTATMTTSASSGSNSDVQPSSSHLTGGDIAAIVICSILGACVLLALLICLCCRKRRKQKGYVRQSPTPTKRSISAPKLLVQGPDAITVTTQVQRDVEKDAADADGFEDEDKLPQIALGIPAGANMRSAKLAQRASGISQVSSLGNGEDAIRRDDNIPEWGQQSHMLQRPHDSFSIPTEMARGSSKHSRSMSPSKRALARIREKRASQRSHGLGIDIDGGHATATATRRNAKVKKKKSSNLGPPGSNDRSSCASGSTQATILLSTRASEFPRPPTESTIARTSRSIPTLSIITDLDKKRRSIRMLGRSDSVEDSRPIQQKRESFIRNRASTSLVSPLFSHGSRVPSEPRHGVHSSTSEAGSSSGIMSRARSSRFGGSRSTYSQSSSQALSDRDSRNLEQKIRKTFAPNFPRVISRPDLEDEEYAIDEDHDENWEDVTPSASARQSAADMQQLAAEMARPRHLRSWVLPGEASPTPPPGMSSARRVSSSRRSTPMSADPVAKMKWRERVTRSDRSSSPLAAIHADADADESDKPVIPSKSPKRRFSNINEPIGLVSKDSLSRVGLERPRLGETKTSRPVSVEKVYRLSSMKAETEAGADAEEVEGAGLSGPEGASQAQGTTTSHVSGKAFI